MPKRKRDLWTLRPGDLPSERVLALEPRLRDLENNAVFRLLMFQKRGGMKAARRGEVSLSGLNLFPLLILIVMGPVGWLILVLLVVTRGWSGVFPVRNLGGIMGISRKCMGEVILTRITPQDIVLAHWGSALGQKRIRIRLIGTWMLMFSALVSIAQGVIFAPAALLVLPISAFMIVRSRYSPFHLLPACTRVINEQKTRVDFHLRPAWVILTGFATVILKVVMLLGAMISVGLSIGLILSDGWDRNFNPEALLWGGALSLIGGALGFINGVNLRGQAAWNFQRACRNADEILRYYQYEIFERGAAKDALKRSNQ